MIKLNIHEAKTHLSAYLDRIIEGETVILCRRNVPIAEIRALPKEPRSPRPFGLAKREFEIPSAFFEPLPADLLADFTGEKQ